MRRWGRREKVVWSFCVTQGNTEVGHGLGVFQCHCRRGAEGGPCGWTAFSKASELRRRDQTARGASRCPCGQTVRAGRAPPSSGTIPCPGTRAGPCDSFGSPDASRSVTAGLRQRRRPRRLPCSCPHLWRWLSHNMKSAVPLGRLLVGRAPGGCFRLPCHCSSV